MSAPSPADILPAWSEPFHVDGGPGDAPTLRLPRNVSRNWVYGDGSGRGARVAIIDSGIESDHSLVGQVDAYVAVERDDDADTDDEVRFVEGKHDDLFGHGTACAGLIRSLAPEAELVSVRVLGEDLRGSGLTFAHGLEWCIEHGVHVVNLSLSTANEGWAETFWDLVDQAVHRGVMLVSAMNNERKRCIPSEFSGVFSVACAVGTDPERVWFNPHGPAEWGTTGIDIEVAWLGGSSMTVTGNSFAAAVISGHLARIVSAHPGIRPWQAKTILAQIAQNASHR